MLFYLIFLIQKSPFPLVVAFLRNLFQGHRSNSQLSRFTRPVCFCLFQSNFVWLWTNSHNLVSMSATTCSSSYDFIKRTFFCIFMKNYRNEKTIRCWRRKMRQHRNGSAVVAWLQMWVMKPLEHAGTVISPNRSEQAHETKKKAATNKRPPINLINLT